MALAGEANWWAPRALRRRHGRRGAGPSAGGQGAPEDVEHEGELVAR
jgi:hypothetical protein